MTEKKERWQPDISYVDTDTRALVAKLQQGYEALTEKKLYPADPINLFILWIADLLVQQRVLIDYSAKMNIPRFAQGEYLDELVEFLNDKIKRLPAQPAQTKLRFTLSEAQDTTVIIPKGNRVGVDDALLFETVRDLFIPIGETEGEVEATCTMTGEIGNGFEPGTIYREVDFIPYLEKVRNVTTSAGGADTESDDSLYSRYREALATYSVAGPTGAYIFYAKTASTMIGDVKALSPVPGDCEIRILMRDGSIPDEEIIQKVEDILSADEVRPLTDHVYVLPAEKVDYDIDLTFYTFARETVGTEETERRVWEGVHKYQAWQSEKMGRDINPSKLVDFLMDQGIKRVEIREPEFKEIKEVEVGIAKNINIINGGGEDE